jgi:alanyl aminopeptidase
MSTRICLSVSTALFACLIISACSESPAPAESSARVPVGQLGDAVVPTHYNIELRIDPSQDTFSGQVAIDIQLNQQRDSIWLHGKNLDVSDVYLTNSESNRIDASYEEREQSGVSLVTLEQTVDAGPAKLHFIYEAPFNTATNALFKATRGDDSYAATQFEPIGARQVFPGFDEPAFKVPFDLAFVIRADDVVVTTTPETSRHDLGDGFVKHMFETTRPLPTYLLAIAVGPYDLVDYGTIAPNAVRDRELPLRAIAAKGQGGRLQYALKHTDGILSVLEEYFGTPYPYRKLDLIAMPESFGGAMENVGAITYDEYLLLMDENSPLNQRRTFARVHAHELGHMWFGNLVTPHWWNDIWLNESFASWIMDKAAHAYWPEGEFDRSTLQDALLAMSEDSLASARQIREPVDHNDKIIGAFDSITYDKGAGVLTMLERYVGEDRFRDGIRLHMERNVDGTATAEDFIESVLDCQDGQDPQITVRQARYAPLGSAIEPDAGKWQVPMCINYLVDGVEKSSCSLVGERTQSIRLDAESCPTSVHPNAGGSGYYRFSLDDAGWRNLVAAIPETRASEALALGDSLDAAFRAGTVSADIYASGMAALVNHEAWDVADAATDRLEAIAEIVEESHLGPLQKAFSRIVRPRFEALENRSDSGSRILHRRMQRFLIVVAKDPHMREPLARMAAARMGLDGDPDPSAAPAAQLETILSVGVQNLGEPFFGSRKPLHPRNRRFAMPPPVHWLAWKIPTWSENYRQRCSQENSRGSILQESSYVKWRAMPLRS